MRKNFGKKTWLYPMPVLIIGTYAEDGTGHGGTTHIRLNVALPLARVKEAFGRMDEFVFSGVGDR